MRRTVRCGTGRRRTLGADEEVAAGLEAAADRAFRRGAIAEQAAALAAGGPAQPEFLPARAAADPRRVGVPRPGPAADDAAAA